MTTDDKTRKAVYAAVYAAVYNEERSIYLDPEDAESIADDVMDALAEKTIAGRDDAYARLVESANEQIGAIFPRDMFNHGWDAALSSGKPAGVSREDVLTVLRSQYFERGNDVRLWPEDEAEAYREPRWSEGFEAAREVMHGKAADAVMALFAAPASRSDTRREEGGETE